VIINTMGQVIYEANTTSNRLDISLPQRGVYIVKVNDQANSYSRTIVIE
jgi:hypothetical protein